MSLLAVAIVLNLLVLDSPESQSTNSTWQEVSQPECSKLEKDLLIAQDGDWVLGGFPVTHNLPESDELVYRACRPGIGNKYEIRLMTPSQFWELRKTKF